MADTLSEKTEILPRPTANTEPVQPEPPKISESKTFSEEKKLEFAILDLVDFIAEGRTLPKETINQLKPGELELLQHMALTNVRKERDKLLREDKHELEKQRKISESLQRDFEDLKEERDRMDGHIKATENTVAELRKDIKDLQLAVEALKNQSVAKPLSTKGENGNNPTPKVVVKPSPPIVPQIPNEPTAKSGEKTTAQPIEQKTDDKHHEQIPEGDEGLLYLMDSTNPEHYSELIRRLNKSQYLIGGSISPATLKDDIERSVLDRIPETIRAIVKGNDNLAKKYPEEEPVVAKLAIKIMTLDAENGQPGDMLNILSSLARIKVLKNGKSKEMKIADASARTVEQRTRIAMGNSLQAGGGQLYNIAILRTNLWDSPKVIVENAVLAAQNYNEHKQNVDTQRKTQFFSNKPSTEK